MQPHGGICQGRITSYNVCYTKLLRLQVAKDPGVEIVWIGYTLMVLGTLIAFFLSHRRIWVTLSEEEGRVKVLVGGSGHRNQPGFALYFDEFVITSYSIHYTKLYETITRTEAWGRLFSCT